MKNDRDPAFPVVFQHDRGPDGMVSQECGGMTLRDYFAGIALRACVSAERRWTLSRDVPIASDSKRSKAIVNNSSRYAELAYKMADAMLAERSK